MDLLFTLIGQFLIYTMLMVSLNNFIIGKIDIWAVGHIAFFGVGSFFTGTLILNYNLNPWLSLLIACLIGLIASIIIGFTTLRLKGDFFIILSIAFSELVRSLSIEINGPSGLTGIVRPNLFNFAVSNNSQFVIFLLVPAFVIIIYLSKLFKSSRLELITKTIRKSENLAATLKIPALYYKMGCFVFGSLFATLIGGLYTFFIRATDPGVLTIYNSIIIFTMVMLGGLNSIRGSIIGGIVYIFLPLFLEYLINSPDSTFYATQLSHLAFGIILILIIIKYPNGIMGEAIASLK